MLRMLRSVPPTRHHFIKRSLRTMLALRLAALTLAADTVLLRARSLHRFIKLLA